MHPIVTMDIPDIDAVKMSDVVDYLNEVLDYYGPPCDFYRNYTIICTKMIRNRKYDLAIGPYDSWYIRKFCDEFAPKENNDDSELKRSVRNQLNCDAQTYG